MVSPHLPHPRRGCSRPGLAGRVKLRVSLPTWFLDDLSRLRDDGLTFVPKPCSLMGSAVSPLPSLHLLFAEMGQQQPLPVPAGVRAKPGHTLPEVFLLLAADPLRPFCPSRGPLLAGAPSPPASSEQTSLGGSSLLSPQTALWGFAPYCPPHNDLHFQP